METHDGDLLGCVGVMPSTPGHPIGVHFDVGWCLTGRGQGHGHATEAARAALADAFKPAGLTEVVAYTAPGNLRSQALMSWLRMRRDPSLDFTVNADGFPPWRGLVWVKAATQAVGIDLAALLT